jgi:hypothetical protein
MRVDDAVLQLAAEQPATFEKLKQTLEVEQVTKKVRR